jgi:hypothetical protein
MLTDNEECELLVPSTPNGRTGFFFRTFHDTEWERYHVRSPYTPVGQGMVEMLQTEEQFKEEQAKKGIIGYYSPRHRSYEGARRQIRGMTQQLYRQEHCGEFVEPEAQLFSYSDIAKAFQKDGAAPLRSGVLVRNDIQAFAEDDGNDNE